MDISFQQASPVLNKIIQHGYEAYFVGGSVRDSILNRKISDIDIATSATPEEIKSIFPKTFDVGIEHGTVVVLFDGVSYEITTFRTESTYKNFRKPESVQFVRSLKEDLKRRDFTMNAMALSINDEVIDYFQGKEHLKKGIIQTVGNPMDRFSEDALRMMRAVRFASQLDFSIEQNTYESIKQCISILEHISVERKLMEMNKLLDGMAVTKGLQLLLDTNMYKQLPMMVELKDNIVEMKNYSIHSLSLLEKWVVLLTIQPKEEAFIDSCLKAWKHPSKTIKEIKQLIRWVIFRQTNSWDVHSIYTATVPVAISVEKIRKTLLLTSMEERFLVEMYKQLPIKSRDQLAVTGKDILLWVNKRQGPWLGVVLEKIELAILTNELKNEKEEIEKWIAKMK